MSRVFVIPAKPLDRAKERLSADFTPDARKRLVLAMLSDVVAAAVAVEPTWVLCSDPAAAEIAEGSGARVVTDAVPLAGLNASLEVALRLAADAGFGAAVVVASDLPCVTAADLAEFPDVPVAIAPSTDGSGTNVLALAPPGVIPPRFGPASRTAHEELSRDAGITPVIVESPRLATDVDTPDDVARARAIGLGSATAAALHEMLV